MLRAEMENKNIEKLQSESVGACPFVQQTSKRKQHRTKDGSRGTQKTRQNMIQIIVLNIAKCNYQHTTRIDDERTRAETKCYVCCRLQPILQNISINFYVSFAIDCIDCHRSILSQCTGPSNRFFSVHDASMPSNLARTFRRMTLQMHKHTHTRPNTLRISTTINSQTHHHQHQTGFMAVSAHMGTDRCADAFTAARIP